MRRIYNLLFFMICFSSFAQIADEDAPVKLDSIPAVADPNYREDQFYTTVSYDLVQEKPGGYSQYSFSTGLSAGFLRDMPVNKRRNHSVAIGFGYAYSNIKHNLVVSSDTGKNVYSIENGFHKNKLVTHYLEVPLELRWRNSDSISHKFWRAYLGFKVSYLFYDKAQYEPDTRTSYKVTNDPNLNNIIYGTYLSIGWNTWNLYAYYGLNPMYNNAVLDDGRKLTLHSLKLGLVFYIL